MQAPAYRYIPSLTAVCFLLWACGSSGDERPPGLDGTGEGLGRFPGMEMNAGGARTDDEQPPSGGSSNSTLQNGKGTVVRHLIAPFDVGERYIGRTELSLLDEAGGIEWSGSTTDGQFEFTGVEERADVWVIAEPSGDSSTLGSVTLHNTTNSGVEVSLLPESVLSEILSVISTAPQNEAGTGHLLLRALDSLGDPLSGVRADIDEGAQGRIYAIGPDWDEFRDNTTDPSLVLFYNIAAQKSPGTKREITLEGAMKRTISVPIVAGAITMITVRANP